MFRTLPVCLVFLATLASAAANASEVSNRSAEVSGVFGSVSANTGAGDTPIRTGTMLAPGTTIRTGSGAAVDLYLGSDAGVIRLTQNTTLRIERLADTNGQADIYLDLQRGTVLGNGSQAGVGSRYQIKTAVGVAALGGAAFRLHAEGYLVVMTGTAHFAHVPANGEAKLHTLNAPPPVYFSPIEGVKPAPHELVREVVNQSKARLGS